MSKFLKISIFIFIIIALFSLLFWEDFLFYWKIFLDWVYFVFNNILNNIITLKLYISYFNVSLSWWGAFFVIGLPFFALFMFIDLVFYFFWILLSWLKSEKLAYDNQNLFYIYLKFIPFVSFISVFLGSFLSGKRDFESDLLKIFIWNLIIILLSFLFLLIYRIFFCSWENFSYICHS